MKVVCYAMENTNWSVRNVFIIEEGCVAFRIDGMDVANAIPPLLCIF